jgi:phosphatidylglycerophosphate synthase
MRRTSVRTLALVLVSVAAVGALLLRLLEGYGVYLPAVGWVECVAILALAGGIFTAGWAVRAYQKGDRPNLDPLRAARTFVLAKAGALTGALLGGRYLAEVAVHVGQLEIESRLDHAVAAAIAIVCSLVLAVVGLVVEKFCELPPSDDAQAEESPDPLPS